MPELLVPTDPGFYTLLLVVLLLVALKRLASRLGDDAYDVGKQFLSALLRRVRPRWTQSRPIAEAPPVAAAITPPPEAAAPAALLPPRSAPPPESPLPAPSNLPMPQEHYRDMQALPAGDIAKLYRAHSAYGPVVLKLATELADNAWLQHEATTLRTLAGEAKQYAKHLPVLHEQFRTQDGRVANVLAYCEGYDLYALRQHFPQGVEPRHVIWMLRRVLSILGYVHEQGILHGNIEPAHIIVRPQDHNIWLIDWCYAITRPKETGATFRALNALYSAPEVAERKTPLPAADFYSLGLTMLYLLGGEPTSQTFPPGVPERLQRFIQFLLRPSAIQRPQEAWKLYHELEKIRTELFGPHQFVEFKVGNG